VEKGLKKQGKREKEEKMPSPAWILCLFHWVESLIFRNLIDFIN
jgi:hypothetical protein